MKGYGEKELKNLLPIFGVEHHCILSKQGDITIAYEVQLPELFTLADQEYEALHQALIKAIKILPRHSIFHKQDWFTEAKYKADFLKEDKSFLAHSSERFFNERPYLDHQCYITITKKPANRKPGSSLFSNLLRRNIVPEQTIKPQLLQEFFLRPFICNLGNFKIDFIYFFKKNLFTVFIQQSPCFNFGISTCCMQFFY